jgi:CDP-glycerol glycerophosphotransferase (TagB/SpsB family)
LHPEIKIVFRPHPLLKDALFKSPNKYEKIYQREIKKSLDPRLDNFVVERIHEMLNLPNVFLSTGTLPEDILESDALITSGVSIIGYFAATGKPMLIYRDSNSPEFGQNGSGLLPFFEVAKNTTELLSWLQSIIKLDNLEINHHGVKKCHEIFPTFDKSPLQIALES